MLCSYNDEKTNFICITRCNHRNGAVFSHVPHYGIEHESTENIYLLPRLLLLLSSYTRIAGEMISVAGRDFHLWNLFLTRLCTVSWSLLPCPPFLLSVCVCAFFISHPLYTNIWLITLLFICEKMMKKNTTTDTDIHTPTDNLLTANWIDFLAARFSLFLFQCYYEQRKKTEMYWIEFGRLII